MSESNEDNNDIINQRRKKNEPVSAEYVKATKTLTETYKDGTTIERKVDIEHDHDYSLTKIASRKATLADFGRNRNRFIGQNSSTDNINEAENGRDTPDN